MALAPGSFCGERFGGRRARVDDVVTLDVDARARTAPRCQERGRAQFIELLDNSLRHHAEFDVEFIEVRNRAGEML